MKKSKLIIFLKKFTIRELRKLEEMLASPYFNRSLLLIQLYELIKTQVLKNDLELDKMEVFKILFPEKKRFDTSLSVLMSKLMDLAEQTLVLEQLRLRPQTRDYLLMQSLGEKGDNKGILKIGETNLKKLESIQKPTREDYNNRYLITNLLYELKIITSPNQDREPEKVVEILDAFYLSHRLPLTHEMLSLQLFMPVNYPQVASEKVLELSNTMDLDKFHLIRLNHHSVLVMRHMENEQYFQDYLLALKDSSAFIPTEELHRFYAIAQNYCVLKIIKGKREYAQQLFEVYKAMISKRVLFITKHLPSSMVKNIVSLSCQVGEYGWAHNFLEGHKAYLDPETRKSTSNYYEATIYFYQQDHKKAQLLLSQMQSKDFSFEVGRKFVLLKIYYELQEESLFFSLLHSFSKYIRTNKSLAQNMKTSYLNFGKVIKQLAKIRYAPTHKKIEKVTEKLAGYQLVSDRRWLEVKLKELVR